LLSLYREAGEKRRRKAFEDLRRLLSPEDLDKILNESRRFREGLRLG